MGRTSFDEGIARLDIPSEYDGEPIEADEIFKQSLSYLLGWIATKKAWTPILADNDGRMLVTSSATRTDIAINSKVVVSTSPDDALAANANRKQYIITNFGAENVIIRFGDNMHSSN